MEFRIKQRIMRGITQTCFLPHFQADKYSQAIHTDYGRKKKDIALVIWETEHK